MNIKFMEFFGYLFRQEPLGTLDAVVEPWIKPFSSAWNEWVPQDSIIVSSVFLKEHHKISFGHGLMPQVVFFWADLKVSWWLGNTFVSVPLSHHQDPIKLSRSVCLYPFISTHHRFFSECSGLFLTDIRFGANPHHSVLRFQDGQFSYYVYTASLCEPRCIYVWGLASVSPLWTALVYSRHLPQASTKSQACLAHNAQIRNFPLPVDPMPLFSFSEVHLSHFKWSRWVAIPYGM